MSTLLPWVAWIFAGLFLVWVGCIVGLMGYFCWLHWKNSREIEQERKAMEGNQ